MRSHIYDLLFPYKKGDRPCNMRKKIVVGNPLPLPPHTVLFAD